jgi:cytochrome c oxidase assembly factor 4
MAGTSGSSAQAAQVRTANRRDFATSQLTSRIDENMKLTDCYYEKKDWRACKQEVSPTADFRWCCFRAVLGRDVAEPSRPRRDDIASGLTNGRWRSSDSAGNDMAMIRGRIRRMLEA